MRFLFINDLNDVNTCVMRHFSLDKGHHLAIAIKDLQHEVYFLTSRPAYCQGGINYIPIADITPEFLVSMDYVVIVREPMLAEILEKIDSLRDYLRSPKSGRQGPRVIIKSDSVLWVRNKEMASKLETMYGTIASGKQWVIDHIDFICAQNELCWDSGLKIGIPPASMLLSSMSISSHQHDFSTMVNPYPSDHSYCVPTALGQLCEGRALLPLHYVNHPEDREELNRPKKILVYTGRVKTNNGKIFFDMRDIMERLGDEYELHLFPGSFFIPNEGNERPIGRSGKDVRSLELLRDQIFPENRNVIIHFPYQHHDKYRHLLYADCGIDFSDVRPRDVVGTAGHAKILEYCEMGLPVVCEENIQNLYLVENGKNAIVLPYRASADQYVEAIREILSRSIDRDYCRRVTLQNENWDRRASELLDQLEAKTI